MNTKFELNDVVIFKADPNSGEMIIYDIKDKYYNYPLASKENPVIFVKYWDKVKQEYEQAAFYSTLLKLVNK